jgi:hypothetical protein
MPFEPLTLVPKHGEKVWVPHLRLPALVDLIRDLRAVADIKLIKVYKNL